ncbi:ATP-binding cassette domain-containing protein [Salipiger sp. 1_MG-2023]|nr:ATP-binding cassette domain-containing protein [Salipiger sp. 1_MG-2023]MDO6585147.1 ATP-binding cassette domain-containing protein [Salipiger sp. 1_MG-2023]
MSTDMLSIRGLDVHFPMPNGQVVRAVDGVSLSLKPGETVGLVGESGSGKTTVGKTVLRLVEATSGEIRIGDVDVRKASLKGLKRLRRKAQIIFQDPHSSLNPRMTIHRAVAEGLILNTSLRGAALHDKVSTILESMAFRRNSIIAIRTSCRAGRNNGSASRARWSLTPIFWCWTSRHRRWTCRCRRRSSGC